ncbi:MAG TPA: hypothetical protein VGJ15_05435 [Pirellulales bacterium]
MCLKKHLVLAIVAALCCVASLKSNVAQADDDGAILNPPAANKYQPEDTITNKAGDRNTDRNSRQIFDRINARQTDTNTDRQPKTNEIPTVKLNGRGRQASDKFKLESGLTVFNVTNDGESNFIVRLLDRNGKEVETLFNEIGPFTGEKAFFVPKSGQCLLDVQSSGNWTADVNQNHPTEGQSTPCSLQGKGYKTTPTFQLDKGLVVFKLNHQGESRFKVALLDQEGRTVGYLVNTLGNFTGSKPISVDKPGVYFLNVSADGDWTIDVQ